ncbi:hypothetical protein [Listeria booriae]|uniref:hypothetical protein n=1 Tax=Listeria booriae TaxID=1552123 RepID=UPI0016236C1C|nr:hypothetical protein [Listeria booriae]MBC2037042.1 hypothetical protein [Listeria booriae]
MSNLNNLFTGPIVAHEIKIENKTGYTISQPSLLSGNQKKKGANFQAGEKRSLYLPASDSDACELEFIVDNQTYSFALHEKIDIHNQVPIIVEIVGDSPANLRIETYREKQEVPEGKVVWKDSKVTWGTAIVFAIVIVIWLVNIL